MTKGEKQIKYALAWWDVVDSSKAPKHPITFHLNTKAPPALYISSALGVPLVNLTSSSLF
jgi:hypothetical protein